jgi:hypothetical protein
VDVADRASELGDMLGYEYSYLVGALIFVVAWVGCYWFGRSYRAQEIWGSVVSAPFALTGFLFIPQYWSPPSLFNLDNRIGISIEDIVWSAAVGGIASVVGEICFKSNLRERRGVRRRRHYAPFVIVIGIFILLEVLRSDKAIYNMIAAFALGVIVLACVRPDLILQMVLGAAIFTALYFALFKFLLFVYPEFIQRFYNTPKLLGIYFAGIPVEEIAFAATGGAIWSVAYEYVHGYRVASVFPPRMIQIE